MQRKARGSAAGVAGYAKDLGSTYKGTRSAGSRYGGQAADKRNQDNETRPA